MAVSDINSTNAIPLSILSGRDGNVTRQLFSQLNAQPVSQTRGGATQQATFIQQTDQLINDTLSNLGFTEPAPADALLFNDINPILTAIEERQGLTPTQQNELLINQVLQNLNPPSPVPPDILLINETNPILAAEEATQTPTLTQQTAQLINNTLQTVAPAPPAVPATTATTTATAATTGAVPQNLNAIQGVTGLVPEAAVTVATSPLQPITVTTTQATTPTAVTVASTQGLTTVQSTFPLTPDMSPYVIVAYEVQKPYPTPEAPKPIRRQVMPSPPVGAVRPVDRLVLRQAWEREGKKGQERKQREYLPLRAPQAERSIRQMVRQVNEDLDANGLPLRLVLARHEKEYAMDVYDCSDNYVCRMTYDISLDLKKGLSTILDNLQHETGIIVNTMT